MSTMTLILILALGGAAMAVMAFAWTVRTGQLDDLDTPPRRMLTDELRARPPATRSSPADEAAPR